MKGVIRKLTTLGIAGIAVSGLVLMPQRNAFALTQQEILEKLNTVPVFLIVNDDGESLTASVNSQETEAELQVPIVFINSTEAEAFLEQAEAEEADFANQAQIAVLPLSDVYAEASSQLDGANSLVYIPSTESVNQASQIVNREVQGVPLYAAVDLENERYLLTGDNTLPMFFSFQDLQSQLSALIEQNPELGESIGVEVVSFEVLLDNMTSDDPDVNRLLELVQFVPSSQTIQYLRSLPVGGGDQSPAQPPAEGEGAESLQ